MKINENIALLTPRTLLVPYLPHHVPTYHTWMQSAELQQLTASEPLSLDEEYAMQASWRADADKLTFIVCLAAAAASSTSSLEGGEGGVEGVKSVKAGEEDMVGDVNLFLVDDDENEAEMDGAVIGEVEIMIASPTHRGKGLAKSALLAFLWYIVSSLPDLLAEYAGDKGGKKWLKYLRVKIDKDNVRSIRLFEGVGFVRTREEPNYFGEVELRLQVVNWKLDGVEGLGEGVKNVKYDMA